MLIFYKLYILIQCSQIFERAFLFWKVPGICPFVLQVRATCYVNWNMEHWRNDIDRENEVPGRKPVPVLLFLRQISLGLSWDRNRIFAVRDRPVTNRLVHVYIIHVEVKVYFVPVREHSVLA